MQDFPDPINEYINSATMKQSVPAFFCIDSSRQLVSLGGNISFYGFSDFLKGAYLPESVGFLGDLLPLQCTPTVIPRVEIKPDVYADIHLFEQNGFTWGLFMNVTPDVLLLQKTRQKHGELVLLLDQVRQESQKAKAAIAPKLMGGVVHALALVSEMRDPYTAGHQQKVSHLAVAIAKKMNLCKEEIEGISTSGILHDVGKMKIPVEILTRPGKLTSHEWEIVKTHPRAGYDILKTIDFPWQVAEVVYQHHERLDGSGYPRNLRGGDILLGSQILAVADVVEAMSNHRPYRPALGVDAALMEIRKNKQRFSADVVEACVSLIQEDDIAFLFDRAR
jgi:putative nucleotidyltransferase with HDIG domain